MSYESHIRGQVDGFMARITADFPGVFEWVEGFDSDSSRNLDHLDDYEDAKERFNKNPLEVSAGMSTEEMTETELDKTDTEIREFAEDEGTSVEISEAAANYCVYTFYLHGSFLDAPA